MSSEEIGTTVCTRCGAEVLFSRITAHYVYNSIGTQRLCNKCEYEFRIFQTKFFIPDVN